MRVLTVHNYTEGYATGGEAHVFQDEITQLEQNGHSVGKLICCNSEATESSILKKSAYFLNSPWSKVSYYRMERSIQDFQPDIIHIHNFFFILSPSIFRAAKNYRIPVVVTLHNYRLVVPCSQLYHSGKVCEKCLGKNPWRILIYRCYRDKFLYSLLRYRFYYLSQKIHNWWDDIEVFIALTEFGREKLIQGGLPSVRIVVKPNSVKDPPAYETTRYPGHGALYVGTLTSEKGVRELVRAWQDIDYPLTILGEGPLKAELMRDGREHISFRGIVSRGEVNSHLARCAFLVMPSICYEGFGLTIVEAMAMGKSVLASNIGAMKSIVTHGKNGLHFEAGNVLDLQSKVNTLISDPYLRTRLGQQARKDYLDHYTPEKNYESLMEIYSRAIERKHGLVHR